MSVQPRESADNQAGALPISIKNQNPTSKFHKRPKCDRSFEVAAISFGCCRTLSGMSCVSCGLAGPVASGASVSDVAEALGGGVSKSTRIGSPVRHKLHKLVTDCESKL